MPDTPPTSAACRCRGHLHDGDQQTLGVCVICGCPTDSMPGSAASDGPFLVEHYQDWSDYPGWEPYENDEGELRFATVGEARAYIDQQREADIADSIARWEAHEATVRAAQERHAQRTRVLDEAGLGKQDGEHQVLWSVPSSYKRPDPESRSNFRVALDGPKCPTCGGRSTARANKEADRD